MNDKEATQIFLEFATGALSTEKFWERYKSDVSLQKALIYDKKEVDQLNGSPRRVAF